MCSKEVARTLKNSLITLNMILLASLHVRGAELLLEELDPSQ